ncbi:MAG: type IV pilus twitching motility protein PilT [bacterium]|nr:type IV pilus twitching motility protein PilT [bacterium]
MNLRDLLSEMIEKGASDLHLSAGIPPVLRINGGIVHVGEERVSPELSRKLSYSIMNEDQRSRFEQTKELDFSFGIPNLSRFRANVYLQRGVVSLAIRQIPFDIMSFDELGLPQPVRDMAKRTQGLVLITGPTGSGKSTTLASMIDWINTNRNAHIITIEDPIEYLHHHKQCIINQREVRADTESFPIALRSVLRQDPDVILIGEMRDLETVQAALTIAETGHLCLATLHTNSAYESIHRVIDIFPAERQAQITAQLAFVLAGVVTQELIPNAKGTGRAMAAEILICTGAIKSAIREDKVHQLYGMMQAGTKHGMKTMNQSLYELYVNRQISIDEAIGRSRDANELRQMLGDLVGMDM